MQTKRKQLAISVAIPLLTGVLSAIVSGGGMKAFSMLSKPPLSPPGWLFPVVWTILYILMGIASFLVYQKGPKRPAVMRALTVYGLQLAVNFLWSVFFFRFGWYWFSFLWLVLLWFLILVTIIQFEQISKPAALLLVPYLLWVTFAGYLNVGVAILNGGRL